EPLPGNELDPGTADLVELKVSNFDGGQHDFPNDPTGLVDFATDLHVDDLSQGSFSGVLVHVGLFDGGLFDDAAAIQPGGYSFETFVHEIGHALGLTHPHDEGDGTKIIQFFPGVDGKDGNGNLFDFDGDGSVFEKDGMTPDKGDISHDPGDNGLNSIPFTVMTYHEAGDGYAATPLAFDIAAIQRMYGAVAHNGSDTVYTLSDDMISYSCIWDTGGTDAIQYNGIKNTTIDLRAATLLNAPGGGGFISYIHDVFGGFTIAADVTDFDHNGNLHVIIENAFGGGGNDTITGNEVDNRLEGRDGQDTLAGGGGFDTL